jgi:hypothetical protein
MFTAIRKAILTRLVTGILITGVGVHTGFRAHNGSPESCIRKMRGKNICEKK